MKPLLSKEEISELLAPLDPEPGTGSTDNSINSLPVDPARVKVEFTSGQTGEKELLQIKKGSFLDLEKFPGPLELFVDNRLVARGKFVQVEGHTGIIITRIYSLQK